MSSNPLMLAWGLLLLRLVLGTQKALIVLDTLTNHLVQVFGSEKKLLSKFLIVWLLDGCIFVDNVCSTSLYTKHCLGVLVNLPSTF